MKRRLRQSGVTTVEFAIIGVLALTVLFAVIEVGRAVFVMSSLNEATRRATRMAQVCPINDPAIVEVALFNVPGGGTTSPIISNLTPANVAVVYLDRDGDPIADPNGNFSQIHYVRTSIVNYQHTMLIPFLNRIFAAPDFTTTLRRESLGVPREGAVVPC